MRTEIVDLNEVTDSQELMLKKSPPAVSAFISIVAIIIVIALIWTCFGEIDTYISANGEIRTQESVSTIALSTGGKLKEIFFQDGSVVKKDDVIFEFDSNYNMEQKGIVSRQLSDKETDIGNYSRLINAIKEEKNPFKEDTEQDFYYQYLRFKTELDTAKTQIRDRNEQNVAARAELDNNISQAENSLKDAEQLYEEFSNLYNSIKNDTTYSGKMNAVVDAYNVYVSSREKAKVIYDNYLNVYEGLLELEKESPDSVTEGQLKQAEYSKNTALADWNAIKLSTLNDISGQLAEIESQIKACKDKIASYTLKKDSLTGNESIESATARIKNSYYLSVNNTIDTVNNEINALKAQLLEINEAISNCSIKAMQDGVILYEQDLSAGDTINPGTRIASIVPQTDNYQVVIYIPEHNISSVKIGQKVEFAFASISVADFGKVYGEIQTISNDSFANQADGQKYYRAVASIEKTELTNSDGETRVVKTGMLTDVRMITGTQKIISWILDKLNFT